MSRVRFASLSGLEHCHIKMDNDIFEFTNFDIGTAKNPTIKSLGWSAAFTVPILPEQWDLGGDKLLHLDQVLFGIKQDVWIIWTLRGLIFPRMGSTT